MPRKSVAEAKADERRKALLDVAKAFKGFRPASEVLKRVRAVPTRFPQLDFATRVGGLPVERFMLLHGPSNEGKTALSLGLEESFLALDHAVLHGDAERTTPITWVEELMHDLARHPLFFADRPKDYETTIAKVREFLNRLIALNKKSSRVISALVVIDSLRKLVPADLMKEILTADKEDSRLGQQGKKITAGRDRRAQLQAKMNAAWMDELVPLLDESGAGFIAIAREMQDPDADPWARKFGNDYKVGGGGAIYYDASLSMRVQRAAWVDNGARESKERVIYGERHRITIKKTKVGGKDAKVSTAYFHTSNGHLDGVPFGFDRARDVLELAQRFDIVKSPKQGWLVHGKSRWQGEHRAVQRLTADPAMLRMLESEVRERFADHKPAEHDAETGEVE